MTVTGSLGPTLGSGGGYALIVHGGAGELSGPRLDAQIGGCIEAAQRAKRLLEAGATALDAVQAAVMELEDDPRFNAATGGVLTCDGTLELDAAIMDGGTLRAGAVCSLPAFKNPIAIARAALDEGKHVLYSGVGAAALARHMGFTPCDPAEMITAEAREQLADYLALHPGAWPTGTVGAVARDNHGHLAAATSTGGVVGKRPGRVGDTPLLGAGIYADDALGAAVATGVGEGIMRVSLCARVTHALAAAAQTVDAPAKLPGHAGLDALELMMERTGARGGVILLDRDGRIGWARSTQSMAYAAAWADHKVIAGG